MKKIILLLLIFVIYVQATNVAPTTQYIRSYPLNHKNMHIKSHIQIINKDIDIFGIRDKDNGTAISHGSIGDLKSIDLSLGYGVKDYISLFYNLELLDMDYAGENLKNTHHDIYAKLNLYNNPSAIIEILSTDIGIIYNNGNDLSIVNSNLNIAKMSNLSDKSLYIRTIAGTKIKSSILDFYFGLKYTKIYTSLDSISYDRSEFSLNGGFQYTIELGSYLVEIGYEYLKLFNRKIDTVKDNNHIFNLSLSYALNNNLILSIGGKLYSNQYNGIIPYLHNSKTINSFDQKIGYGSFGFVYNFNF